MTFQPTAEQLAIIEAAKTTKDNLLINAYAGAAKTTTLDLLCTALTGIPILSLAFNKKIAVEMAKRLPSHVKAQTLNSLGHGVWGSAVGKRLVLDDSKTYNLVKAAVAGLSPDEREEANEHFSDLLRAIGQAKVKGYVPARYPAKGLLNREDFFDSLEEGPPPGLDAILDEVLHNSIQGAYSGVIDFNDQIYMPTLFGGSFPRFPLVMVDEAQDLSPLNHAMLGKLVANRVIAVGDPFQSIYGFRGAVVSGMAKLRKRFTMTEMRLSISFRCPRAIIRRAWFRVPEMKWPEWAAEGEVRHVVQEDHFTLGDFIEDAAIICRNNAPLFRLAFRLIRAGRAINLVGSDVGPQLIRIMKKLGPTTLSQQETLHAITRWETEQIEKKRKVGPVKDKGECMRVFAEQGTNLGQAIAYAEHLFAQSGPLTLLTGHKAKGLEWDVTYHLDPWLIKAAEDEQEANLKYVIETRAKKSLIIIDSENIHE